jgi:hypothetical protein
VGQQDLIDATAPKRAGFWGQIKKGRAAGHPAANVSECDVV